MADHVQGKRIMLTGGSGFLGAGVRERLEAAGAAEVTVTRRADYDLTDATAVAEAYEAAPRAAQDHTCPARKEGSPLSARTVSSSFKSISASLAVG